MATSTRRPTPGQRNHAPSPLSSREIDAALRHTLAIVTAPTRDVVVERALTAARAVTRADVAILVEPNGARRVEGDAGVTGAPSARAPLDGAMVVVAGTRLVAAAESLLALVLAHAQAALDRLDEASRDPLTGLCHHRPFEQRLARSNPGHTAVIAVDVDYFKEINDTLGHQAGNRALLAVVEAMRSALREQDELFRIGGDEFAVIAEVNRPGEMTVIVNRLVEAARRSGHPISVGAALRGDGEPAQETLRRADEALYEAKRAGRDTARLAA